MLKNCAKFIRYEKKDLVFKPCDIRLELKSSPRKTNVLCTKLSAIFLNEEMLQIISK